MKLAGIGAMTWPNCEQRVRLVSSQDQVPDLHCQMGVLEVSCATKGWPVEIVADRGSGLNSRQRGLRELIKRIREGDVSRLVLTHQDRLLRFGAELVFALCEHFGTDGVATEIKNPSFLAQSG